MFQASMKIGIALGGHGDARLEATDIALLQAIKRTGSVAQAGRACGISYRHAWGRIAGINAWAGCDWVTMARGRGATLSAECADVLGALAALEGEFAETRERVTARLNETLAGLARRHRQGNRWRLSHDLLIEQALMRLNAARDVAIDAKFGGSRHNLESLATGACEFAGFHIPASDVRGRLRRLAAALPGLREARLLHLMDRVQGLMVPAGNPKRIRGIGDLARRGVRFINRQKNSGSRELFDALLRKQRVDRAGVNGYGHEEFTHFAVAAAVSSGMADAAFGIEAAARQAGLDFLPLAAECYFIAAGPGVTDAAESAALIDWFCGDEAAALAAGLGGYTLRGEDAGFGFRPALRRARG
jgi:molybdate transport repressor ModE-like protein